MTKKNSSSHPIFDGARQIFEGGAFQRLLSFRTDFWFLKGYLNTEKIIIKGYTYC